MPGRIIGASVDVDGDPVATFETDATVGAAEAMQDDRPVVPFESLAPDASSEGPDEDPFPWMNKL